jgi:cobalt-zinc-cadmium efflux system outer membrane protein
MQHLERSPEIARWETELKQRRAALDLEKARRIPDLTVRGGVQWLNETNDRAFVLGLSVPLSLFDRNQGGISEARHNLLKAVEHRRAADVQVRTALARAHGVLSSSHLEASILKNDVLPAALQAFAASREGYRQGKFGYLQVLDAQRTLLDARAQYIDALARYHIALAGAERLIGRPLDVVSQPTEQSPEEAKDEE